MFSCGKNSRVDRTRAESSVDTLSDSIGNWRYHQDSCALPIMAKLLVFKLLAEHDFRPADIGYLTTSGVVRADAFVSNPGSHLMPVRALEHIAAGHRGRFVEVRDASGGSV